MRRLTKGLSLLFLIEFTFLSNAFSQTENRDQRGLVMEMMYRYCGMKQREIGRELEGMDYTQVSHERGRIRERMEVDSKVRRWNKELEALLVSKTKI